eukprot:3247938-Amphidinium_carterae.1
MVLEKQALRIRVLVQSEHAGPHRGGTKRARLEAAPRAKSSSGEFAPCNGERPGWLASVLACGGGAGAKHMITTF